MARPKIHVHVDEDHLRAATEAVRAGAKSLPAGLRFLLDLGVAAWRSPEKASPRVQGILESLNAPPPTAPPSGGQVPEG